MKKLLENIKHLPSTIAGGLVIGTGVALTVLGNPITQNLAAAYPGVGKYVTAATGIAGGLALILGVGPKNGSAQ